MQEREPAHGTGISKGSRGSGASVYSSGICPLRKKVAVFLESVLSFLYIPPYRNSSLNDEFRFKRLGH